MREPYSFILQPSMQIDDDMRVIVTYQGVIHGGRAVLIDVVDDKGKGMVHLSMSVGVARQLVKQLELADMDSFYDDDEADGG